MGNIPRLIVAADDRRARIDWIMYDFQSKLVANALKRSERIW